MNHASLCFANAVDELLRKHHPANHPFFRKLRKRGREAVANIAFLDGLYLRYQSAMHATRVMVYFLPHLDAVDLRMTKLHILADDDGLAERDNHQYQLRRTWEYLMRQPPSLADTALAGLEELKTSVDPFTANFIAATQSLYPRSLGPFVIVESLADEWIGALLDALGPHCPGLDRTAYFRDNLFRGVEVEHRNEARRLASAVFDRWPEHEPEAEVGASQMAIALDDLWHGCELLLEDTVGKAPDFGDDPSPQEREPTP